MHRIDSALRSELATLAVLVAALAAQMPHAARLFASLASGDGAIHSWLYAVALETAVLVFVVRGRRNVSYMFAGVSVAVNLSYYAIAGVVLWNLQAFPAWLVSISLPVAIMLYSHDMAAHSAQDATGAQDAETTEPAPIAAETQKTQPAPAQRPTVDVSGLNETQINVLRAWNDGHRTNSTIAEVVEVNPSTVSRSLKALREGGHLNGHR